MHSVHLLSEIEIREGVFDLSFLLGSDKKATYFKILNYR